jgi:hypothetical protein
VRVTSQSTRLATTSAATKGGSADISEARGRGAAEFWRADAVVATPKDEIMGLYTASTSWSTPHRRVDFR